MKIRTLVLAGLFVLPTLGLVFGSPGDDREAYRPSGRSPGFDPQAPSARFLPAQATPETAVVVSMRSIPSSGIARRFTSDATTEDFFVPESGSVGFSVSPGSYVAAQDASAEWILDAIECDDDDSTSDVSLRTALFQVDSAETVDCRFTNKAPSTLFYSSFERGDTSKWMETPPSYCAGFCGDQSPSGCYCDAACIGFGDCCPDVCLACGTCG